MKTVNLLSLCLGLLLSCLAIAFNLCIISGQSIQPVLQEEPVHQIKIDPKKIEEKELIPLNDLLKSY